MKKCWKRNVFFFLYSLADHVDLSWSLWYLLNSCHLVNDLLHGWPVDLVLSLCYGCVGVLNIVLRVVSEKPRLVICSGDMEVGGHRAMRSWVIAKTLKWEVVTFSLGVLHWGEMQQLAGPYQHMVGLVACLPSIKWNQALFPLGVTVKHSHSGEYYRAQLL